MNSFVFGDYVRLTKCICGGIGSPSDYLTVIKVAKMEKREEGKRGREEVNEEEDGIVTVAMSLGMNSQIQKFSISSSLLTHDVIFDRPTHFLYPGNRIQLKTKEWCVIAWTSENILGVLNEDGHLHTVPLSDVQMPKESNENENWIESIQEGDFVKPHRNILRVFQFDEMLTQEVKSRNSITLSHIPFSFGVVTQRIRTRSIRCVFFKSFVVYYIFCVFMREIRSLYI
jgi:hypothetical protein